MVKKMVILNTDYGSAELNSSSAATIDDIHQKLVVKPLGTAMVLGNEFVLLLPLAEHTTTLSALSIIRKAHLNDTKLPALYEFDYLVRGGLTDENCLSLAERLPSLEYQKNPCWKRWIIDYYQDLGEDSYLSLLVNVLETGRELTVAEFHKQVSHERN